MWSSAPYSRAVASLRAWRREHISLAGMYLISFANDIAADPTRKQTNNPLHVKGTGGSELKGSLLVRPGRRLGRLSLVNLAQEMRH